MACLGCRQQGLNCAEYQKRNPGCACPNMCIPPHVIVGGSSSAGEKRDRLWRSIIDLYGDALPIDPAQQLELEDKLLQLSETVPDNSPEFYNQLANIYSSYNLDIAALEAKNSEIEVTAKPEAKIIPQLEMGAQLHQMKLYTPELRLYKEITQGILPTTRTNAEVLAVLSDRCADSFRAQRRISEADFAAHQAEQWRIAAVNLP